MVLSQRERGFGHEYRKAITGMGRQCQKAASRRAGCLGLSCRGSTVSAVGPPPPAASLEGERTAGGPAGAVRRRDTQAFLRRRREVRGPGAGLRLTPRRLMALTATGGVCHPRQPCLTGGRGVFALP